MEWVIGVWGLGFVVCGLWFVVWGLMFEVWGLGFNIWGGTHVEGQVHLVVELA